MSITELAEWGRWKTLNPKPAPSNELFNACFRIQREACEAAGRYIPMVIENVRGAQPWVGPSKWHAGSTYLWGDVPAIMPTGRTVKQPVDRRNRKKVGGWFYDNYETSHRRFSSHSLERKAWSAQIAKIPFALSRWIAKCFKPHHFPIDTETHHAIQMVLHDTKNRSPDL